MFDFPDTFKENNEDYIVVNAMKRFLVCRPAIKKKMSDSRQGLLKTIVDYANTSAEAEEEILSWIDTVVREGIKDLYIKGLDDEACEFVKNVDAVYEAIAPELEKINNEHLCKNVYSSDMKLVKFHVENTNTLIYTFYLCQAVFIYDGNSGEKVRWYPVCVDIYPDYGIIVGRGKPRQNMYSYNKEGFDIKTSRKTAADLKISKCMEYILRLLQINVMPIGEISWKFKNCLYKLLEKYTDTPTEIQNLIEENMDKIDGIVETLTNDICKNSNKPDIESDILNLVEKYFSINYEDKNIFTKGREAYPLRIAATDEEESKVDQKSAREHPLQSKAIFFDNKKMMQKSKICDGVIFKFRRINKGYYEEEFKVKISVKNNCCCMKFFEYTEEVDIQNVLQLFINS